MLLLMFLIWQQDKHSPLYVAKRVGKDGVVFNMIKLRSMIKDAEQSGVDSTGSNDIRITRIGKYIRRYKLDEFTQLINVFLGQMSLVGPRPNVKNETDLYTDKEKLLLSVKPGITDFASIVFSDEGDILQGSSNPDLSYNQLIRPGKSALGLFYIENRKLSLDIKIIYYTFLALINRKTTLRKISLLVQKHGGSPTLSELCNRAKPLVPAPPPGSDQIVTTRNPRPN